MEIFKKMKKVIEKEKKKGAYQAYLSGQTSTAAHRASPLPSPAQTRVSTASIPFW
jgi:hypothetical protein